MFCFPKQERLCAKVRINSLFYQGKAFLSYPFSVRYLVCKQENIPLSVLIVCPKRYQKKAVDRNYIKRCMREAWRLNNSNLKSLLKKNEFHLDVSLSYISKERRNYNEIEEQIKKILVCLEKKVVNQIN